MRKIQGWSIGMVISLAIWLLIIWFVREVVEAVRNL